MAIDNEKVKIAKAKSRCVVQVVIMIFPWMNAINNHSSKSGNKQHGATTSKSTAIAKFPSGLVPNWQTMLKERSFSYLILS